MKQKIFSILALLCLAVSGAWAADTYTITATYGGQSADVSTDATLPYETTLAACYKAAIGAEPGSGVSVTGANITSGTNVTIGTINNWDTPITITAEGVAHIELVATFMGMPLSGAAFSFTVTKNAPAVEPITVYFTDAKGWGDVKVYYWPNGGEWPGQAMTYVKDNEYSQKVYKAQVPANVEGIIFNGDGNSKQTVDITENIANNAWWYSDAEGGDGKFTVGYVGKYLAVTPTENPNEWTFEMPGYDVEVNVEYCPDATITTAPAAADVAAGTTTELVSAGVAEGGTIYYALGTDDTTAPAEGWSTDIPTAETFTETSTAYVWYMVVGDDEHNDIEPQCVAVQVTNTTYYVIGTMTGDWDNINTEYQLQPNTETEGEYYIHDMELTEGTEFKVVSSTDNGASIGAWFPAEGSNYVINTSSTYSIYFRPDGQGDQNYGWHYGYIYVEDTGASTGLQTVKGGNTENTEWYNLNGQKVQKPTKGLYINNGKKVVVK